MLRHVAVVLWLAAACSSETAGETAPGTGGHGGQGGQGGGGGPSSGGSGGDTPSLCGNETIDSEELCDGGSVLCADLGSTWSGGNAACRSDCEAWDVSACTLGDPALAETVKPATRDATQWGGALCNDGTPFSFVVRLAAQPTNVWVIYLQGGVYCDDYSFSCLTRLQSQPALTTTSPQADGALSPLGLSGLLANDPGINPTFATANHVHAHYCSSDFWAGATSELRPTGAAAGGWYFAGHAHVASIVEILIQRYGLDDTSDDLAVLLSGGSAGAFGAHFNAAAVRALLPAAASRGTVRLFVDAGWMTDWDNAGHRLGAATTDDRDVWTQARSFWGATFDPDCEAAANDPVDCFFGTGWYPALSSAMPVFVQQSKIDNSFMGVHGLSSPDPDVALWETEVTASLAPVAWLHAGDTSYHVIGLNPGPSGLGLGPPGNTLREMLARFWSDAPPEHVEF